MNTKRFSFALFPLLVLFLAGCSNAVSITPGSGNGTTNNQPKSQYTVLDDLQRSARAMQNLKSAHLDLKTNGKVQGNSTNTSGNNSSNQVSFNIAGTGDESLPDQAKFTLKLVGDNSSNQAINTVVQKDKVYVQNPSGKWYVFDKAKVSGLFSQVTPPDLKTLLAISQDAKLTDHNLENVNGQSLRHISAELDKEGLRQLMTQNQQLRDQIGARNIDAIINNTKTFKADLDFWIDETQFYVHRSTLNLNLNADTTAIKNAATPVSTAAAAVPINVAAQIVTAVDFSHFNEAVTIAVPSNATPTDNPTNAIF